MYERPGNESGKDSVPVYDENEVDATIPQVHAILIETSVLRPKGPPTHHAGTPRTAIHPDFVSSNSASSQARS